MATQRAPLWYPSSRIGGDLLPYQPRAASTPPVLRTFITFRRTPLALLADVHAFSLDTHTLRHVCRACNSLCTSLPYLAPSRNTCACIIAHFAHSHASSHVFTLVTSRPIKSHTLDRSQSNARSHPECYYLKTRSKEHNKHRVTLLPPPSKFHPISLSHFIPHSTSLQPPSAPVRPLINSHHTPPRQLKRLRFQFLITPPPPWNSTTQPQEAPSLHPSYVQTDFATLHPCAIASIPVLSLRHTPCRESLLTNNCPFRFVPPMANICPSLVSNHTTRARMSPSAFAHHPALL